MTLTTYKMGEFEESDTKTLLDFWKGELNRLK